MQIKNCNANSKMLKDSQSGLRKTMWEIAGSPGVSILTEPAHCGRKS